MNGNRDGNFLAGVIIGAMLGAAIALLYAPQSGEKTRKLVSKKAKEIKKKFPEIKEKAQKAIKKAETRAKKIAKEFRKS